MLAKLDSGHRGSMLTVPELLAVAAAVNMPPALLLFPGYPDGEIEYLPGPHGIEQGGHGLVLRPSAYAR